SWVADPLGAPGDDLPSEGRSLFDLLLGGNAELPDTFEKLVHLIPGESAGSLLPDGRSLQRKAVPKELRGRFPRVVKFFKSGPGADRLFLGYQEKANTVEVISYNELARRFEFQLVRDFGPGLRPRVVYAQRSLCLKCHQNRGPIFSARG